MKWFCIRVLDTLYSLLGNWLRDHTSWALSGIGVKIKSLPKNFWSLVLNFTTPKVRILILKFWNLHTTCYHFLIKWICYYSAAHLHISNTLWFGSSRGGENTCFASSQLGKVCGTAVHSDPPTYLCLFLI